MQVQGARWNEAVEHERNVQVPDIGFPVAHHAGQDVTGNQKTENGLANSIGEEVETLVRPAQRKHVDLNEK